MSRPRRGADAGIAEARQTFAKGELGPVVLLAGPERLFADELIAVALKRFVPVDLQVFNFNRYRGGQDDGHTIFNAAATLPMFCERRIVVVADADGLPRGDMERLTAYLASPSPSTILILVASEAGEKLPAALKKVPERYTLWRPFPKDGIAWAIQRSRELGHDLPLPVAEELYAMCTGESGDSRAALSDLEIELEKICLSAGQRRRLVREDLRVVSRHAESRVLYQIESAVAERQLSPALAALDAALLFPRDNGPIRITAMLGERFRKMLVARDRMDAGYGASAVVAGMWFGGPGGSAPFLRSVSLFSRAELSLAVQSLARLDRALKTGQAEPDRLHLELALRTICGASLVGK
ncbi:MAG: DNA polymerase III subunit delta [Candidatus Eisenbacteria bacterium]|nr:DNA polymerase III subunit delta [Candidatus Eisenbacteria bacterium]